MKRDKMGGAYSNCGKRRGAYRDLVRRSEERIPLGRHGHSGRIILTRTLIITLEEVDWIDVAQDRSRRRAVLNAAINFRLP
jgi:hypothetical protein